MSAVDPLDDLDLDDLDLDLDSSPPRRIARHPWAERVKDGNEAEDIIADAFVREGWTVIPYGRADADNAPRWIRSPVGLIRPLDLFVAKGAVAFHVEAKSKKAFRVGGYGLDAHRRRDLDCWQQLQLADRYVGPTLLVIYDPEEDKLVYAHVSDLVLRAPRLSRSKTTWMFEASQFEPLDHLLEEEEFDL